MFIYDYIIYNGEPIIEFRLKYLNDYVDYFIITESIYTHSGKKKDDFYYYINKDLFEPYRKKILFHSIHVLPSEIDCLNIRKNNLLYENKDSWINEVYQRDSIQKIMNTTQYFKPFIILFVMLMKYQKDNYTRVLKMIMIYYIMEHILKCFY